MQILRQSTSVVVRIGPAVAIADGIAPVTNLTLSGADEAEALRAAGAATLDISGATFAAVTGADGWYDLTLDTTATNTVGTLDIAINDDSLILPIFARFQVVEEAVYDQLYAASAPGAATPANLATVDGIVDDIKQMIGHKTTIATLASQTSFTLTAGSADDDAYNGWAALVVDQSTAEQIALGIVNDYTGSTKTITLKADPAVFTMAASDIIILLPGKLTDTVDVEPTSVRDAVGLASANLDTQLGDLPTNAELSTALAAADDAVLAAIAALNNLSAAEVNAEVVDALATDTYAEPGQGAPAATASLAAKVNYLYKLMRNKITQTATELSIYADDGTTVDHKATVSDDSTTFTRSELVTGA